MPRSRSRPSTSRFALPDGFDFGQGAALVLNYHTAYFALAMRGRLREGESVLVHGAAGGVGTAALQVAKGLGARTIAVVSSDEKERVAREAGADEVVRTDGPWKDAAKARSGGGVDVVVDPVGGDRFTDSLRSLRTTGGSSSSASPAARSRSCASTACCSATSRGRRGLGRLRDGQATRSSARSART